jgi:hypothetical protein
VILSRHSWRSRPNSDQVLPKRCIRCFPEYISELSMLTNRRRKRGPCSRQANVHRRKELPHCKPGRSLRDRNLREPAVWKIDQDDAPVRGISITSTPLQQHPSHLRPASARLASPGFSSLPLDHLVGRLLHTFHEPRHDSLRDLAAPATAEIHLPDSPYDFEENALR